jgi:hypothetical protein
VQKEERIPYHSPERLRERRRLPENLSPNIAVAQTLGAAAAE